MIHPGSLGANVGSRIGHKIKTTNILKQRVAALNKQKYVWTTPLSIYDPRHPRYSEKVYYYNKVTKRIESKLFYQIVYELRTYAKTEAEYFAALNRGDHTVKPPKSMIEKDFVVSQFSGTSLVEHMDSIELRLKVANMLRDKSSEDFKKLGFDFEVNDLPDFNINALREFEWRLNNFEQIKIDYDNRPNIISRLQKQLSKLVSDRDKLIAERNEAIKEIPDVAISEAVKTKDIKTIDIEIEKNQKLLSLLELRKKYEGLTDDIIDRSNKRTSYTEFDKVNKKYILNSVIQQKVGELKRSGVIKNEDALTTFIIDKDLEAIRYTEEYNLIEIGIKNNAFIKKEIPKYKKSLTKLKKAPLRNRRLITNTENKITELKSLLLTADSVKNLETTKARLEKDIKTIRSEIRNKLSIYDKQFRNNEKLRIDDEINKYTTSTERYTDKFKTDVEYESIFMVSEVLRFLEEELKAVINLKGLAVINRIKTKIKLFKDTIKDSSFVSLNEVIKFKQSELDNLVKSTKVISKEMRDLQSELNILKGIKKSITDGYNIKRREYSNMIKDINEITKRINQYQYNINYLKKITDTLPFTEDLLIHYHTVENFLNEDNLRQDLINELVNIRTQVNGQIFVLHNKPGERDVSGLTSINLNKLINEEVNLKNRIIFTEIEYDNYESKGSGYENMVRVLKIRLNNYKKLKAEITNKINNEKRTLNARYSYVKPILSSSDIFFGDQLKTLQDNIDGYLTKKDRTISNMKTKVYEYRQRIFRIMYAKFYYEWLMIENKIYSPMEVLNLDYSTLKEFYDEFKLKPKYINKMNKAVKNFGLKYVSKIIKLDVPYKEGTKEYNNYVKHFFDTIENYPTVIIKDIHERIFGTYEDNREFNLGIAQFGRFRKQYSQAKRTREGARERVIIYESLSNWLGVDRDHLFPLPLGDESFLKYAMGVIGSQANRDFLFGEDIVKDKFTERGEVEVRELAEILEQNFQKDVWRMDKNSYEELYKSFGTDGFNLKIYEDTANLVITLNGVISNIQEGIHEKTFVSIPPYYEVVTNVVGGKKIDFAKGEAIKIGNGVGVRLNVGTPLERVKNFIPESYGKIGRETNQYPITYDSNGNVCLDFYKLRSDTDFFPSGTEHRRVLNITSDVDKLSEYLGEDRVTILHKIGELMKTAPLTVEGALYKYAQTEDFPVNKLSIIQKLIGTKLDIRDAILPGNEIPFHVNSIKYDGRNYIIEVTPILQYGALQPFSDNNVTSLRINDFKYPSQYEQLIKHKDQVKLKYIIKTTGTGISNSITSKEFKVGDTVYLSGLISDPNRSNRLLANDNSYVSKSQRNFGTTTNRRIEIPTDSKYASIDIETSGLGQNAHIVSIGIHIREGERVTSKYYLIRPEGFTIEDKATEVHGITTRYALEHGRDVKAVLNELVKDFLGVRKVVGHNVQFDLGLIISELRRQGIEHEFRFDTVIDTMQQSVNYVKIENKWGGNKFPKLEETYKFLFPNREIDKSRTHNALYDAQLADEVYIELRNRGIIDDKIIYPKGNINNPDYLLFTPQEREMYNSMEFIFNRYYEIEKLKEQEASRIRIIQESQLGNEYPERIGRRRDLLTNRQRNRMRLNEI